MFVECIGEALYLLEKYQGQGRVMAGGTNLMMVSGRDQPDYRYLVNISLSLIHILDLLSAFLASPYTKPPLILVSSLAFSFSPATPSCILVRSATNVAS